MKFSLTVVALAALATSAVAAPVEKRDVDLGLIKSIAINDMSMDFTAANPWAPTTSSNSVVATMVSIAGISLPIKRVRQHIIISDNGKQIGNIDTPWATASVSGSSLKTSLPASPLNVFADAHTAFSSFVGSLSTKAQYPLTLKGSVDAELDLGLLGTMTINGIGFNSVVPFAGLNNLDLKYAYLLDTNLDTVGLIKMGSIIKITNPSKLTVKLGDIALKTSTPSGYVGVSKMKALSLAPGVNYVLSTTELDGSLPATQEFLGNLYTKDGTLSLTGYESTSTNPALNAGLAPLKSTLVVPANFEGAVVSQSPYKNWSLKVLSNTAADKVVQITATFQSPYYGLPYKLTQPKSNFATDQASVTGVSSQTEGQNLFSFSNDFTLDVSGSGSVTATFNVDVNLAAARKAQFQDLVNYGASKGYIPVTLDWMPTVIVNGDGVNRIVDFITPVGSTLNIAVGSDFASILNAFP
ncbi:hypothetical protein BGX31_010364 [Mortierella sp. GBA43]|nr:hypothetical protein BGX31_010364 [Mortierella sp. GBA43]